MLRRLLSSSFTTHLLLVSVTYLQQSTLALALSTTRRHVAARRPRAQTLFTSWTQQRHHAPSPSAFKSPSLTVASLAATSNDQDVDDDDDELLSSEPNNSGTKKTLLLKANAASKWIITLACAAAVWSRPRNIVGPYLMTGSIWVTSLTNQLKRLINQQRPAGAPFSDPGMPSSHSLVSFFLAAAWSSVYRHHGVPAVLPATLYTAATVVAWLRVAAGFHTIAQIAVGGVLGILMGYAWMCLGQASRLLVAPSPSTATRAVVWTIYAANSLRFLLRYVTKWMGEEKYL